MKGTFFGLGALGREGFCSYFLFPCIPCPLMVLLQGQGEPTLGLTTKDECGLQSITCSCICRFRAWVQGEPLGRAGAGQHVLQPPMEEGAAEWKGFEKEPGEEGRRGEGADSQPRDGGGLGTCLQGFRHGAGRKRLATGHIISICGRDRWPQVFKVSLGSTLRSSGEGLRG